MDLNFIIEFGLPLQFVLQVVAITFQVRDLATGLGNGRVGLVADRALDEHVDQHRFAAFSGNRVSAVMFKHHPK